MTITVALHGFLGVPSDFDEFKQHSAYKKNHFVAVDYMNIPSLQPQQSLNKWGHSFVKWLKNEFGQQNKFSAVGYSMGGRLLLHAIASDPSLFSDVLFYSVNPGLLTTIQKQERLKTDALWSDKFLKMNFNEVLSEWNSQPVFIEGHEPTRFETNYDKHQLANALINWSLANQIDFRPLIAEWPLNQTWVVGDKDTKFVEILKGLPERASLCKKIVQGSHRCLHPF